MSLKLNLLIARTHLFAKKKQTIIASLGVTFGIGMFILMISFMTGVNKMLEDTMLAATPHIKIFNELNTNPTTIIENQNEGDDYWNVVHHKKPINKPNNLKNGLNIVESIRHDNRILGVSPYVSSQVFYNYGPSLLSGTLVGVNILDEDRLYNMRAKLIQGNMESVMTTTDGVLMGVKLAKKMNVKVGDRVQITTPQGQTLSIKVVGIFEYGIGLIDESRCYGSIPTVQKILQKDNRYITEINIKLHDLNQAREVAKEYQKRFVYKVDDWENMNASVLVSFKIRNIMTYVVVMTLLVVAGFGIYNIMNMTIYDKMKDIAILKAIGLDSGDIVKIFLYQSLFIGFMGGIAGLLIGFMLSYILSQTPFDSGGFLNVKNYPVNFDTMYYIFGMVFGMLTTLVAGYLPSKKAGKIDPVSILRG